MRIVFLLRSATTAERSIFMPEGKLNKVSKENEDTNIIVLPNKAVYLYPYFCVPFSENEERTRG